MQRWTKIGCIFKTDPKNLSWNSSGHSQCPVAQILDDRWRIYYASRDNENQSRISFIDVEKDNPTAVLHQNHNSIIDLGSLGSFDNHGMMPGSVVDHNLFYFGIYRDSTLGLRNSIGLLVKDDNKYKRFSDGPILSMNIDDPYFVATPFVKRIGDLYHMWYLSVKEWRMIDGKPEFFYHIKHASSTDMIEWKTEAKACIELNEDEGGLASPCVIFENGIYKMWYSYRKYFNYRTDPSCSYKIGYAESLNGKNWERKDSLVVFDSDDQTMMCYPNVIVSGSKKYMFYNGNFGKDGIYCAFME